MINAEIAEGQRNAEQEQNRLMNAEKEQNRLNTITGEIIGAAMKVHDVLGPGLLEKTYEVCLAHELNRRGMFVQAQVALPVVYEGMRVDLGYRIDLLVENSVIVELKAQEGVLPIHHAQLLSYLRLSGKRVGLLLNFHAARLKDGITRIVNRF
ncbi:MAG: GxxExxY protein [Terriglobales bacterium]